VDIFYFKKLFWEKAKKNNIPASKIDLLWKKPSFAGTGAEENTSFLRPRQED